MNLYEDLVYRGLIKDVSSSDLKDKLNNEKLTFYIGSIWPDCTPSFLTKRHCIEETFDIFMKKMFFLLKNDKKTTKLVLKFIFFYVRINIRG